MTGTSATASRVALLDVAVELQRREQVRVQPGRPGEVARLGRREPREHVGRLDVRLVEPAVAAEHLVGRFPREGDRGVLADGRE
jgi:hypothetical protein